MNDKDRLDICETMYGKLNQAFGKFYWTTDKRSFVNIETGEDLLADVDNDGGNKKNTWMIYSVNRMVIKICKYVVVNYNHKEGVVVLYGKDSQVKAKIKKTVTAHDVKEYVAEGSKKLLYRIGKASVANRMTVCILDYDTQELEECLFNVMRIFDSGDTIDLVLYDNGKMIKRSFNK